jgi:hypothetical protein
MKAAQHRFHEHDEALAYPMSSVRNLRNDRLGWGIRYTGSERHVRARTVVMADPALEDRSKVGL